MDVSGVAGGSNSSLGSAVPLPHTPASIPPTNTHIASADKCYRTAMLAAIARHGPLRASSFTQVLVRARGSLGAVVGLLGDIVRPATSVSELRARLEVPGTVTGTPLGVSAGSMCRQGSGRVMPTSPGDLVVQIPDSWLSDYQNALAQLAMPRLDAAQPRLLAAPAGLLGVLALCRTAAGSKDVARVLASKTQLVPLLLAIMGGRRFEPRCFSPWSQPS